jgi:hypothetical protein
MTTTNHPLIGKRIEHKTDMASPCTVAHIFTNADSEVCALVVMDDGSIDNVWLGGPNWRIVTPEPAAEPTTAAPQPDADSWIPLDGTRFPDVAPGVNIKVKFRNGEQSKGTAGNWAYTHPGDDLDIIAWRRA